MRSLSDDALLRRLRVAAEEFGRAPRAGAVRGLICSRCNSAIGLAHDDPARLRAMAAYLECQHT